MNRVRVAGREGSRRARVKSRKGEGEECGEGAGKAGRERGRRGGSRGGRKPWGRQECSREGAGEAGRERGMRGGSGGGRKAEGRQRGSVGGREGAGEASILLSFPLTFSLSHFLLFFLSFTSSNFYHFFSSLLTIIHIPLSPAASLKRDRVSISSLTIYLNFKLQTGENHQSSTCRGRKEEGEVCTIVHGGGGGHREDERGGNKGVRQREMMTYVYMYLYTSKYLNNLTNIDKRT
jgi:hypothetical protein